MVVSKPKNIITRKSLHILIALASKSSVQTEINRRRHLQRCGAKRTIRKCQQVFTRIHQGAMSNNAPFHLTLGRFPNDEICKCFRMRCPALRNFCIWLFSLHTVPPIVIDGTADERSKRANLFLMQICTCQLLQTLCRDCLPWNPEDTNFRLDRNNSWR